jgi:hypothetical protein
VNLPCNSTVVIDADATHRSPASSTFGVDVQVKVNV